MWETNIFNFLLKIALNIYLRYKNIIVRAVLCILFDINHLFHFGNNEF